MNTQSTGITYHIHYKPVFSKKDKIYQGDAVCVKETDIPEKGWLVWKGIAPLPKHKLDRLVKMVDYCSDESGIAALSFGRSIDDLIRYIGGWK